MTICGLGVCNGVLDIPTGRDPGEGKRMYHTNKNSSQLIVFS